MMASSGADEVRAAFDVGSGKTKMDVCRVSGGRVVEVLFSDQVEMLLAHDYLKNGTGYLSEEILEKAFAAMRTYSELATSLGATKITGIATAVFRKAKNGGDYLARLKRELGVELRIVSQVEEGEIGFTTAVGSAGSSVDPGRLIAYDSGAASFQITARGGADGSILVYEGPWGSSSVLAEMVEKVQHKSFKECQSANPASPDDARALVDLLCASFPPAPRWLTDALKAGEGSSAPAASAVVGIGERTCIFAMAHTALGKFTFTQDDIWSAIESTCHKSNEELAGFPESEMVVPKLCLLYAVMRFFAMTEILYAPTNGSCRGIILTPSFWQ